MIVECFRNRQPPSCATRYALRSITFPVIAKSCSKIWRTAGRREAVRLLNAIREDTLRNLEAIQNVLPGDAGSLPGNAAEALQRQMRQPLDRIEQAARTLEPMLPAEMLPDLSRIRNATRELMLGIAGYRQACGAQRRRKAAGQDTGERARRRLHSGGGRR